MDITIELAEIVNSSLLQSILEQNKLPTDDIYNNSIRFFVAKKNDRILGLVGLEVHRPFGLLRSLAVIDEFKNKQIGKKLVEYLMTESRSEEIKELYLLTTTADKYFPKFGFIQVEREQVPDSIKQTEEFKSICPDSAVVMKKQL